MQLTRSLPAALATVTALTLSLAPAAHAVSADASAGGPIYRVVTGVGSDATSVNFSWRSHHAGNEVVRVAPAANPEAVRETVARDADFGAIAYRSRFADVSGLEPGVTYTYQIGSEDGGWSTPESFTIDDGDGTWSFLALADAQIGVNLGVSNQAATWRATLARATNARPDSSFVLSLGDQVEGWGDLIGPLGQYNAFFSAPQLRQFVSRRLRATTRFSHRPWRAGTSRSTGTCRTRWPIPPITSSSRTTPCSSP
nr:fibronectin type III domain-containing protein [Corynebacterium timonense]